LTIVGIVFVLIGLIKFVFKHGREHLPGIWLFFQNLKLWRLKGFGKVFHFSKPLYLWGKRVTLKLEIKPKVLSKPLNTMTKNHLLTK
jgi:hypothetical protein